jgi:hypothetical protein
MRLQCQEESDHSTAGYRQIKNGQDLSNPAPVVAGNDLLVRELILMQSEAV